MILLGRRRFLPRHRIHVLSAKLFSALEAPRFSASPSHYEAVFCIQAASEYVITGLVFQAPTRTPRTLLRVFHPRLPYRLSSAIGTAKSESS
jgi:hypothetical protein